MGSALLDVDPCKVCLSPAPRFDAVDAAKSCGEPSGRVLPRTGTPVVYFRCGACGLMYTRWADAFTADDFRREIYNDGYLEVDPLYLEIRPRGSAAFLRALFSLALPLASPRVLDFGAGSGALALLLADVARTSSWDPFSQRDAPPPARPFDLVFAREVLEHTTDPVDTLRAMRARLRPHGLALFSTAVQPADIDTVRAGWWYCAPRNGHVSLFTPDALRRACGAAGLTYAALSDEWHMAERDDAPCDALDREALRRIVEGLPTGYVEV